eukprot:2708018-Lingulodinium_polyedra.AAC.1
MPTTWAVDPMLAAARANAPRGWGQRASASSWGPSASCCCQLGSLSRRCARRGANRSSATWYSPRAGP